MPLRASPRLFLGAVSAKEITDLSGLIGVFLGVLLVFRHGVPYCRASGGVDLMQQPSVDEILGVVEQVKARKRANVGIGLVLAGLALQIISRFL